MGDLVFDGTHFYGMTSSGGINNVGTIFKLNPDGTGYSKLLDFADTNGMFPNGSLISDGTFLYGMTQWGGSNGLGTLIKIKSDGTTYSKLLDFGGTNGCEPLGSLVSDGTFLYGMTYWCGLYDMGTIDKIKPDGTGFAMLLDFYGLTNGGKPSGSLISHGIFLYGLTANGGTNDLGTIFKIKQDGTGFVKMLDFAGTANGSHPSGSLIFDGTFLYGMTANGGTNDFGTVFKIKPDGTEYAKLLDFSGITNGRSPQGNLVSVGAFLYGMTNLGGTNDLGTLFKIKSDGTEFAKLIDFSGTANGRNPNGSLISDGTFLYGTTSFGGTSDSGTVFKYDIATGISEKKSDAGFSVFPNPTKGVFEIKLEQTQLSKINFQLSIVNVLGEIVYSKDDERLNDVTIDLSDHPKGIYFLQVKTEKGVSRKKMIVQ